MKTSKIISGGKSFLKVETILVLILGFLLGIMVKTQAIKKITIGFNDYQANAVKNDYDFNQMEKDLKVKREKAMKEMEEQQKNQVPSENEKQAVPEGGSCAQ